MNDRNRHERGAKGAIGAILGIITVGLLVAAALAKRRITAGRDTRSYGNKNRVPDEAALTQGAMTDFKFVEDMRAVIPEPPSYAPA